jgi:hypothetical protein
MRSVCGRSTRSLGLTEALAGPRRASNMPWSASRNARSAGLNPSRGLVFEAFSRYLSKDARVCGLGTPQCENLATSQRNSQPGSATSGHVWPESPDMTSPAQASGATWRGIPKSPRALFKLVGTALLAGSVCAMCGGGVGLWLGLSPVITGSVSGTLGAAWVATAILRYGQTEKADSVRR